MGKYFNSLNKLFLQRTSIINVWQGHDRLFTNETIFDCVSEGTYWILKFTISFGLFLFLTFSINVTLQMCKWWHAGVESLSGLWSFIGFFCLSQFIVLCKRCIPLNKSSIYFHSAVLKNFKCLFGFATLKRRCSFSFIVT